MGQKPGFFVMNKVQLKKFKTLLTEKRDEIVKKAKQTLEEDMTLDANDLPDEMDLASSEYLQSFTFRLRGREKVFLDKIEKALRKIEDGTLRHLRGVRRGDLGQAPRGAPRDDALHPLQRGSGARREGLRLRRRAARERAHRAAASRADSVALSARVSWRAVSGGARTPLVARRGAAAASSSRARRLAAARTSFR